MWAHEFVKRGANVPDPYKIKEILADKEEMERRAAQGRQWVQQGMKQDADANAARTTQSKA